MINYYDKQGKSISSQEWGKLLNDSDYRIIAEVVLPNKKIVSTVWLGLNHSFTTNSKPLIFETMVFPKAGDYDDLDCKRYSTRAEAEEGHKQMITKWKGEKF